MAIVRVDSRLFRGPRPQPSDYAEIRAKFATVVSLEGLAEDYEEVRAFNPFERMEIPSVNVIFCPITDWDIYNFVGISEAYLRGIVLDIQRATAPILVHCKHGKDRTGLIVMAYRVLVSGWSKEEAMAECRKFRPWWPYINPGLIRTWKEFQNVR